MSLKCLDRRLVDIDRGDRVTLVALVVVQLPRLGRDASSFEAVAEFVAGGLIREDAVAKLVPSVHENADMSTRKRGASSKYS